MKRTDVDAPAAYRRNGRPDAAVPRPGLSSVRILDWLVILLAVLVLLAILGALFV